MMKKALLVFGGGLLKEGHLSPWSQQRVWAAALVLNSSPEIETVICCGGKTRAGLPSEAQALQEALQKLLPTRRKITFLKEEQSLCTSEHFLFLRPMMDNNEAIIVTSAFHLTRCRLLAKRYHFANGHYQIRSAEEIVGQQWPIPWLDLLLETCLNVLMLFPGGEKVIQWLAHLNRGK